jgi:hypothetical protein
MPCRAKNSWGSTAVPSTRTDHLTRHHSVTGVDHGGAIADVRVTGADAVSVIDQHPVAIGAQPSGLNHHSGARGVDRRSARCTQIGAGVKGVDPGQGQVGPWTESVVDDSCDRCCPALVAQPRSHDAGHLACCRLGAADRCLGRFDPCHPGVLTRDRQICGGVAEGGLRGGEGLLLFCHGNGRRRAFRRSEGGLEGAGALSIRFRLVTDGTHIAGQGREPVRGTQPGEQIGGVPTAEHRVDGCRV